MAGGLFGGTNMTKNSQTVCQPHSIPLLRNPSFSSLSPRQRPFLLRLFLQLVFSILVFVVIFIVMQTGSPSGLISSGTTTYKITGVTTSDGPMCRPTTTPPLPKPIPKDSNSRNPDLQRSYAIHACRGLGIAYISVYKAGSTSMTHILEDFCLKTTGEEVVLYASWAQSSLATSFDDICSKNRWYCYTFYREPVDRFLSAYHEVMKRYTEGQGSYNATRLGQPLLDSDASKQDSVDNFELFLTRVEKKSIKDPHTRTQFSFVQRQGDNRLATTGGIAYIELSRYTEVYRKILCGALVDCVVEQLPENRKQQPFSMSCPFELPEERGRDKSSEDYGLKQYILSEDDLSDEIISRITKLYNIDYCYFGLEKHPRALEAPRCKLNFW